MDGMRRRGLWRWVFGGCAAIAIPALVVVKSTRPVEVVVTPVTRGHAVDAIYATGTVEAERRVTVKAKIGGPIAELRAREGDAVHLGDLLATVEHSAAEFDLKRGELDASAATASIGPGLASTRAHVTALETQLAAANRDLSRVHALVADNALASVEEDRARDHVSDLDAQLTAARAELQARQVDLDASAKRASALVGSLTSKVSDADIRSPLEGVVLVRYVEPGEVVAVDQPLFKVGDTKKLLLEVNIDESDVGRAHDGSGKTPASRVAASLHAFPGKAFAGHVAQILPDANRDTKTYLAKIALDDPPEGLRSGMTVEVNIIVDEHDGALLVPADAVKDGRVWRVAGGRASRVPINVGIHDLLRAEVRSGVDEGDLVVVSGAEHLESDKTRVHVTVQQPADSTEKAN